MAADQAALRELHFSSRNILSVVLRQKLIYLPQVHLHAAKLFETHRPMYNITPHLLTFYQHWHRCHIMSHAHMPIFKCLLTLLPTHLLTHLLACLLTGLLTHLLTYLLTHLDTHLPSCLLNCLFTFQYHSISPAHTLSNLIYVYFSF